MGWQPSLPGANWVRTASTNQDGGGVMSQIAMFGVLMALFFWWFERTSYPRMHRVPVRLMSWREHLDQILRGIRRFVTMSIQARIRRGRAVRLPQ